MDTHLLRELGELLVGRDSTAMLELIKNAYDADATRVIVDARNLGRPDGTIRIVDDGLGMSLERFQTAFLRIASREKEGAYRRSALYGRQFTGQKGIGRLAAHKLAAWLGVLSIPRHTTGGRLPSTDYRGVRANLDWDLIENQSDLSDLVAGFDVDGITIQSDSNHGTSLELRRLRSTWTQRNIATFVTELRAAQPPVALTDPTWLGAATSSKPLVPSPTFRDSASNLDPGFELRLSGDLEVGDDLWQKAAADFEWMIEIDAMEREVQYQITPTRQYARKEPTARTYRFQRTLAMEQRPRFHARILTKRGASTRRGPLAGFVRSQSGVRVYLEGFRVLPYGEYGDDWLEVDRDYRTGPRFYDIDIDPDTSDQLEIDHKEGLSATGNIGYFGAVFLTEGRAGGLRSLVNREGFVQDSAYESLVDLVQTGIRLSVRVRRAVLNQSDERERAKRVASLDAPTKHHDDDAAPKDKASERTVEDVSVDAHSDSPDSSRPQTTRDALQPRTIPEVSRATLSTAYAEIVRLRQNPVGIPDREAIERIAAGFDVADTELSRLRDIQPDLRVLASVGLQLGAFVHDINGMLGQARTVRELLDPITGDPSLPKNIAARLRRVARALEDLTHTLTRQSSYLADVLTTDPRRRRSRVRVTDRLDVVRRLLADQLAQLHIVLDIDIPIDVKTPPMFPSEVGVLLTNLLTNAVKNAGSPGTIRIEAHEFGLRGVTILIHNTGAVVDLTDSDRWFLPFESTTVKVDEVLGQGLGLGLPITRALVEDYGGSINFVPPPAGFATSIRVDLPDPLDRK